MTSSKAPWSSHKYKNPAAPQFQFQRTEGNLVRAGMSSQSNLTWAPLAPFMPSSIPCSVASTDHVASWVMPLMTEGNDRECGMGRPECFRSFPKLGNLDKLLPAREQNDKGLSLATCSPPCSNSSSPLQGQHQGCPLIKATLCPPPSFLAFLHLDHSLCPHVCLHHTAY